MLEDVEKEVAAAVKALFDVDIVHAVEVPDEQFGDAASNVAMQLARQLKKAPREIAEQIADKLSVDPEFKDVTVAGPGFLNLSFSDQYLLSLLEQEAEKPFSGQTIVAEYSDMNAFKTAHVGHLFTTLVGNAIANLYERAGAEVIRTNFGGDVGLHVGRAMWAIMHITGGDPEKLSEVPELERSAWVAARYVEGTTAYESDESAKNEIIAINKRVYEVHETGDHDSDFARLYWTCRQWSYDGFERFYEQLGLDKQSDGTYFVYFPESTTSPIGKKMVQRGLSEGVFKESDGAIVYRGEEEGLHTRVFLTSQGLPTYEAKDLGLAVRKWEDYHYDESVIITANDIAEYMKVVLRALKKLLPETDGKTRHITHGLVKLASGQKMSSRKGNVLLPEDVLAAAEQASLDSSGKAEQQTVLAAVKYAFLRQSIGQDIIFDPEESVSTHGNSGPYLQYAHARARSIMRKAIAGQGVTGPVALESGERTLARKLSHYELVMATATENLAPHQLCAYLYELAQVFNRFYENNQVIGSEREQLRLYLVSRYADTLKDGLSLLGISAPESM